VDVKAHEADEEAEVHISHNAKKISWTSQNTKTNKSASVSQAVEKVAFCVFGAILICSGGDIKRI
jgi:hypothetical protein